MCSNASPSSCHPGHPGQYELIQMKINLRVTLGFLSCIYGRSICRALQREDLGSMCFPIGEQSIRRIGQARTRQCTPPICALPRCTGSVLLSQCARTVCCSPRAVGPAELSAGHAVVQGQRPQTGHKNGFSVRMVKFWGEISPDLKT